MKLLGISVIVILTGERTASSFSVLMVCMSVALVAVVVAGAIVSIQDTRSCHGGSVIDGGHDGARGGSLRSSKRGRECSEDQKERMHMQREMERVEREMERRNPKFSLLPSAARFIADETRGGRWGRVEKGKEDRSKKKRKVEEIKRDQ